MHDNLEETPTRGIRARKKARNTAISTVVLLVLLVGGGVAYTWYIDQKPQKNVSSSVQTQPAEPVVKPPKPAANAPEGVALASFTSPVAPGSNASMQVHTNPTSTCSISVTFNGVVSKDSGLIPKTADEYGSVQWSWTVPTGTSDGKYPVSVTCTYHGRSGVYSDNLEVSRSAAQS